MYRILSVVIYFSSFIALANGKILATPGVSQIEGSAGGGLVPWAQLAGYATEDELAITAFCTQANVDDFELSSCGVQGNLFDRVELSYAKQKFDVLPLSTTLEQDIYAAKFRVYGDVIYSPWPQLSVGIQHKTLKTPTVATELGSEKEKGTDLYIAASKLHLGLVGGYNFLWNITFRYTEANEMGLLGFRGPQGNGEILTEASAAILFNKHLAFGAEYRQKPDNLGLKENDWHDVFIAWFPNKHISLTAAFIDLGTVAGLEDQTGWYLSLTGYY